MKAFKSLGLFTLGRADLGTNNGILIYFEI